MEAIVNVYSTAQMRTDIPLSFYFDRGLVVETGALVPFPPPMYIQFTKALFSVTSALTPLGGGVTSVWPHCIKTLNLQIFIFC